MENNNIDKSANQNFDLNDFAQRRGKFRIDKELHDMANSENVNKTSHTISPQIRDAAINGVQQAMTHIQGTSEEKAAHNEMLKRCVLGDKQAQNNVKTLINKIIVRDLRLIAAGNEADALVDYIYRNYYGLGPIDDLVNDPTINEVMVNSYNHIWIEKGGVKTRIKSEFKSDDDIMRIIRLLLNFNKMDISVQQPRREARMLDGSRLTVTVPPVAKHPTINIRKFDAFDVTTENLLKAGTISEEMCPWIQNAISGRSNIMIIGETGSGKTSFLKWLIGLMDPNLRIGTIETNFELKIDEKYPDRNVFSFEQHDDLDGATMSSIFKTCLRSTPDIIICGEARSTEADELIRAMRRGHEGSIGTIHTNSPETCIIDIHEMINEDGKTRDYKYNCYRIASALNFIFQVRRFPDGVRRLTRITEVVTNADDSTYSLNDIFSYVQDDEDISKGSFKRMNKIGDKTISKLVEFGVPISVAKDM